MTAVTCERVFPGRPQAAGEARAWLRAALASCADGCPPGMAADAVLALSELVTNAIRHTRSGAPGGQVLVAAEVGPGHVIVHVRDQGGPAGGVGHGQEGGRGLPIVSAVTTACGRVPAVRCPLAGAADPGGVFAAGTCAWFGIGAGPAAHVTVWERVMERAGWRCQCTGQCGRSHRTGGRCLAEHPAAPLHAVPAWAVSDTAAAALPPAALTAMCGPCHAGHDRRARSRQAAACQPGEALFAEEVAR
jgi:anti-sigma regulatory factor (Ser/Thr protein kinase)